LPIMAAFELLSYVPIEELSSRALERIVQFLVGETSDDAPIEKAIKRSSTSTPHVHGVHKYKAKFFPRMIRSFLTSYQSTLPKTKEGKLSLLDPFVGSGTAIIEGGLLGLTSVGIDIDPLSCAISLAKLELMKITPSDLDFAIREVKSRRDPLFSGTSHNEMYRFPKWISRKFERWGTLDEKVQYEGEISRWRNAIAGVTDHRVRNILMICLSDALSRKFNMRMMGTGVGRFALEIAKSNLSNLIEKNMEYIRKANRVTSMVRQAYDVHMGDIKVVHGTATDMTSIDERSVSVILTSPPYLPASSGRENYLMGKSISITALGLVTEEQIKDMETKSLGSMTSNGIRSWDGIPHSVRDLYEWLKKDPLREIKANPIVDYYEGLRQSLLETFRVLIPGGLAIFVIGKESVFYTFKTREVLYRVKCDDIFQELAEQCGFTIKDRVDVELDKKNSNARPRSLDSYFETVFVLARPVSANKVIMKSELVAAFA
ncbi:MAG: hypothetical protein LHV69_09770, partial [Elusimicrobia bacterium]|nr:hypothetical protein [Candidatus Obscuribacterium magneticum]